MRTSLPSHVQDELAFVATQTTLEHLQIVEIGCGDGEFARRLVRTYPRAHVTCVEVDERQHALNFARHVMGVEFVLGGAQNLTFEAGRFDLALMIRSLHHVPAALMDTALAETARVLRANGLLYVSEPVFDGPFNEVVRLFHDEQLVREQAQAALERALTGGPWVQEFDHTFMMPIVFQNFEEFESRIIAATYQDHRLSDTLLAQVRQRFETHMGANGAHFVRPMRARLLRKVRHD